MKIAMINGSPKLSKSNSSFLLDAMEPFLRDKNDIIRYDINKKPLTKEQYITLCHMDVLILAFPLYIDALPSHLFRMLIDLEAYLKLEPNKDLYVYALVNNGFYEGRQSQIAFDILQNWCVRCGIHFGQGIGQGAGEMLDSLEKVPLGHGPLKNLGTHMKHLAENIQVKRTEPAVLFSPNFPRFAWKFMATHFFWNTTAKKNGLTKKDIVRQL